MNAPLTTSGYTQADCAPGILHLGYGAFHRAHQAFYVDRYMQQSGDLRWGIIAVNLRGADAGRFAADQYAQDYVLKTVSAAGMEEYHALRPHLDFVDWSAEPEAAEKLAALPEISLITITVTESGYYLDDSGRLNLKDPLLAQELAGGHAHSVYAYLHAGLRRRMQAGGGPVSVLCCDNIRANGRMLEANLKDYLQVCEDQELLDWLAEHASFPCAMVDRITPKPLPEYTRQTQHLFGREDGPEHGPTVLAEDFIQWVIEDRFVAPRPQWEQAGVTMTCSVTPYEEAKIRILNGGHLCLAYLGALAGHRTFDRALDDAELFDHFFRFETEEVLPALTLQLPFDKRAYLDQITARFRNASIGDTLERLCMDGLAKHPLYLLPTLADSFAAGREPRLGIRSVAGWYVLARRVSSGLMDFDYIEPRMAELKPLLADGAFDAFANSRLIWGELPQIYPAFADILRNQVTEVEARWPV